MALDANINRRIRNQIPDTDAVFGDAENEYMFTDVNLEDFYTDATETHPQAINAANILRAAAYANLALASSEALISKAIRTQDLQTNGAVVATELRQKARALFDRADSLDVQASVDYFQIVNFRQGWRVPELTEGEDIHAQENNF